MLRHLEPGWHVTALDEAGSWCDSESFASRLQGHEERGLPGVIFVIGSDLGLASGLLDRADELLSLSSMTLPHQIARLLLWEQLFRATNILNGGAYHRVSVQ
jgi:23S rRNA (pseudouridine1915-N3)-methyltransferase